MRHLRRPGAVRTECDADDSRALVDDPDEAECVDCLYMLEKRRGEWYAELEADQQRRREPTDAGVVERSKRDTEPGKRRR